MHHDVAGEYHYYEMGEDLKALFEASFDVIFVSDAQGKTLRVSAASKKMWGKEPKDLIGKSVFELENSGIFVPSVTRLVLEKRSKIECLQTTQTGRRLLVLGVPVRDERGKIVQVVNVSRDVTHESELKREIKNLKTLLAGYKAELEQLKERSAYRNRIVFQSEKMESVFSLARKVSRVDSTVLITGESGVGKEVVANFIHEHSERSDHPFIKINCGALPEGLLESELFGYEPGAFTGADRRGKLGMFELAHGGTLFLDEIGEVPLNIQVKLLRAIQEKEIMRIGGTKPIKVNIRIIAATNKDLKEEVKMGRFRADLYYRLNIVPIHIHPLRERREDIVPLFIHFLNNLKQTYPNTVHFTQEAIIALEEYDWPGNVRELQNMIERIVVTADKEIIDVDDLPEELKRSYHRDACLQVYSIVPLRQAREEMEHQLLKLAKEKYKTTTEIAKALQINQATVSRKLNKYE